MASHLFPNDLLLTPGSLIRKESKTLISASAFQAWPKDCKRKLEAAQFLAGWNVMPPKRFLRPASVSRAFPSRLDNLEESIAFEEIEQYEKRDHQKHESKSASEIRDILLEEEVLEKEKFSFWPAARSLFFYLAAGFCSFWILNPQIRGIKTNEIVDALYFSVVTLTTVGYGDIAPSGNVAKIVTCLFVFSGFFVIDLLLKTSSEYLASRQEVMAAKGTRKSTETQPSVLNVFDTILHFFSPRPNPEDGSCLSLEYHVEEAWRMVFYAAFRVLAVICAGSLVLHFVEGLAMIDAIYCACVTITTVGYGDRSFSTLNGRMFAIVWVLVSTVVVSHFFLCLAEARMAEKQLKLVKKVLCGKINKYELSHFDLDGDGHVSLAEFTLFKLKEMGHLDDEDLSMICSEFELLDINKDGSLDLSDIRK